MLILIDEAQLLRLQCMELIRALLNYATSTEKLCQVVLAGQLELRDRLLTRKYKAFKSRIIAPVVWKRSRLRTPRITVHARRLFHGIRT